MNYAGMPPKKMDAVTSLFTLHVVEVDGDEALDVGLLLLTCTRLHLFT